MCASAFGASTPLSYPVLQTDMNGNGKKGTNFYQLTATNGFSSDGVHYFFAPTNTQTDGDVITATGTGGKTKFSAASGGSGQPASANLTNWSLVSTGGYATTQYVAIATGVLSTASQNYTDVATNNAVAAMITRITSATQDVSTVLNANITAATNAAETALNANITAATNALYATLVAMITAATNDLNTVLRAALVPQSRTLSIDGTSQDLSANRTYSSAPAIASIVTPGAIVTNGAQGYTMVFSNAVNFKDAAGAQMSISNGVIGSVKAITNSGNIASATYSSSGKATFNNINCLGDQTFSGVNFFTIPSDTIGKIGRDFTSLWLVPPVNVQGVFSITNSVGSYRSNAIGPTSITAPATTVNWTNPINANIQVYIDNSGVTGTAIKKNGTQIFSSLVGDVTLELQPQEYFSMTYTLGTPVVTWSPF